MCKISVIIPVYNTEKYLGKCINSVLCQDFSDFEAIIVNDGSNQECRNKCNLLLEKDNRIKVYHKENGGLSSARNFGLNMAKGEYVFFLDSDDFLLQGAFSFLYEKAVKTGADITATGYNLVYGKNENQVCYETRVLKGENVHNFLPSLKEKNLLDTCCGKLYKRSFLKNTGVTFTQNEIYEDTEFNLKLLGFNPVYACFKECFYCYVQHKGSITKRFNENKLKTLEKRYLQLCEVSPQNKGYWNFLYIQWCFSAFCDLFLQKGKKRSYVKSIINQKLFGEAVQNATAKGVYKKIIKAVAKSKNVTLITAFCYFVYLLKYKVTALFIKLK